MQLSRRLLAALVAAWLLACSGGSAVRQPTNEPAARDGNLRLGRNVVPKHYALDLRIDPTRERFSGTAAIQVEVAEPTRLVQLHAEELDLSRVGVETDGTTREVPFELGVHGALMLHLDPPLQGAATLHFAWDAALPERPFGLYRVEDQGRWYAFTQFEPLEARKAFPGFDQPEFKTPYAVTLRVPNGQQAIANAPLARRESAANEDVFVFEPTRPIPTYLVAFAVGDFDVAEGGQSPPTRVVATKGKGRLAGFALERTPRIVAGLLDYFEPPFPFQKLDLVAVPNFGAGAMENVGLVTFREQLLLLDAAHAPAWSRYASQSVIAHELAHMWFGNLVTPLWWDDLWLNESFATWMAARLLEDVDPELDSGLDAVASAQRTMQLDSKRDARQIRQPIAGGGDVYNAFDGITYGKGAAVLRMIEAWLGEDAFQQGVRAYLHENAYGSGGTPELLAALEAASGKPVAKAMNGFLDQPGTPLVETELVCSAGEAPRLRLRQTRSLPAGSEVSPGGAWTVPVCVALAGSSPEAPRSRECFLLEESAQEFALASEECPRWVHPNAGERGYYRWTLPAEAWIALVEDHAGELEDAERAALPGHAFALLEAERLEVGDVLDALRVLAEYPRRHVSGAVVEVLGSLYAAGVADPDGPLAAAWARQVRGMLGRQLDRIGVLPQPGESTDTRLRRGGLVYALAVMGRDPWIRARARTVAAEFVRSPGAMDEEVVALMLPLAAREGDADFWEALVEILAEPPSPVVRETVVSALGSFEDPELLRRSLDLVLDGRLRAQDYRTVAGSIQPGLRPVAWAWVTDHYAQLVSQLGPLSSTGIPSVATGLCSVEGAEQVEAFFDAAGEAAPQGTDRNVRLVVEDIRRCARLRTSLDSTLAEAIGAN
jgi:alanyl aminopeptidase